MILQKLAQAIRRQDWFQVVVEVLIVIVGIFLGLQVQAAYEEAQWYNEETQLLQTLQTDMLENEQAIIDHNLEFEPVIEDMHYTALVIQSGETPVNDDPRIVRAMQYSSFLNAIALNLDSYEAIIQTGNISRLDSDEIRDGLYLFKRQLDAYNNQLNYRRDFARDSYNDIKDIRGWRYDPDAREFVPHIQFEYFQQDHVKTNSIMQLFRGIYDFHEFRHTLLATIKELNSSIDQELEKRS